MRLGVTNKLRISCCLPTDERLCDSFYRPAEYKSTPALALRGKKNASLEQKYIPVTFLYPKITIGFPNHIWDEEV